MKRKIYLKHFFNALFTILCLGGFLSLTLFLLLLSFEKESIYKKNMEFANYEIKSNIHTIKQTIDIYKRELTTLNEEIKSDNLLKKLPTFEKYIKLLISSNNSLFQARYIDKNGNEIIRFEKNSKNNIHKATKLQNKKNRYYFLKTKTLNDGQFYISKLDLNIENEKIETPLRPTIRVSTPVYLKNEFKGILIFNFNAQILLNEITKSKLFDIYYFDKKGNYLIHPDKNKSWSRQLKTNYNISDMIKNVNINDMTNIVDYIKKSKSNLYVKKVNITDNTFFILLKTKDVYYNKSVNELEEEILFLFLLITAIAIPISIFISLIISRHVILLEYIVNSIPHPFYIKNIKGEFIIVNDALVDFYDLKNKKELLGKSSYVIDTKYNLSNTKQKDMKVLEHGKLKSIEKIKSKNDEIFYYEILRVKIPYFYFRKKTYILGIAIDITQIKELNEKLNQKVEEESSARIKSEQLLAQQSKMALMGEMIGNIAHQWRQPLSNIATYSTGMKLQKEMEILKDDELLKGLEQINESAQYLSQTIDDFRNFFKPYKIKTDFTINFIINKALKLVSAQLQDRNIEIIKDIQDAHLKNLENEFTQVLLNLLNNARDELTNQDIKEKLIFISSKIEKNRLIIEIKDNAGGVEDQIKEKIFDAYFTTKDDSKGTGIGLYMSKEIIEKHMNGKLSFENVSIKYNEKIYTGACFKIELDL
ncbi:PAS domain-containing sensor histidine kinase [Arcobacter sp. CECT 8985]|uniref:sensor histidine kinase n=1 Tax=Arcobacter sp. CECT 8985 TaxID=1935424 RepID=UPI0013E99854|nr:PAS domain-containing sensor histidine kinase [Arcobacter sp. CECT 8985]